MVYEKDFQEGSGLVTGEVPQRDESCYEFRVICFGYHDRVCRVLVLYVFYPSYQDGVSRVFKFGCRLSGLPRRDLFLLLQEYFVVNWFPTTR